MALILLAEDTIEILFILKEVLEMEGYEVITAADGQEAWDILQNCVICPDLLITDIMMPNMTGLELVQKIRDSEKFHDLPIAVYSASFQFATRVKALGCSFMAKPFDMEQITGAVCNMLRHNKGGCDETQPRDDREGS